MARFPMFAVALAVASMLLAGAASGQMNPLRQLELTAGDIELVGATADRLYQAGEIGVAASWTNPESGNSGSVQILEIFEREGLPCRRVEHIIKIAKDPAPKRLVLASCRVPDGRWLLV